MVRFSPRPNRANLIRWREWGDAAFAEAQQQDKPIVLVLTAFWCGFCQRLDETTLSDDRVIAVLNAFFIPVRVEESQRPDVDLRYNQNGWPTIAFLTPAGDHLVSVNALEPEPFLDLLVRVVDAFRQDKAAMLAAARAQAAVRPAEPAEAAPPGPEVVAEIVGMLDGLADREYGGFGAKDKFLHTEANEFFLYLFETTGERWYLDHVLLTLDTMRRSRTFDAKDGGFFRYSSRRDWQEPHPEKLLDDQAALLANYLHAYLLTEAPAYRATAEDLIDYLDRTLLDTSTGVFCGCQDYVRPPFVAGRRRPLELISVIDSSVYCDANARAASAYLAAWWLLGREDCRARAEHILAWLWDHLRAPDGGMYHYWDGAAHVSGMLMDAVMTGRALLDASAVLGEARYLERARRLAEHIERVHRNPRGGFFDIGGRGPGALRYPMTVLTQNAAVADFFRRLASLGGEPHHRELARWALQGFGDTHRAYGAFAAGFGRSLAQLLSTPVSVSVAGRPGDAQVRRLVREALAQLRPKGADLWFQADQEAGAARIAIGAAGRADPTVRPSAGD